jgi:phage regulator Rha-like protein
MTALITARLTMSSREISKVVKSRHDSVKRTIERLAKAGAIGLPPLVEYIDRLGRPATEYVVGKRDSYVIVAQLSPQFTARLVDRWQELEDRLATIEKTLQQKVWELHAREVESRERATHGSRLMTARKLELQRFRIERAELEARIQPSLLN